MNDRQSEWKKPLGFFYAFFDHSQTCPAKLLKRDSLLLVVCGRTSAPAPNSATRSRSGASIGRCITSTGSSTSLRTRWSMRLWTSRTAVARAVPGDRAHTARCGSGSGACCAGATTAHAWSRDNHPRRQGKGFSLSGKWTSAIL